MFNPYEWHDHHRPNWPRWRVKAGMAAKREALIEQIQRLYDDFVEPEVSDKGGAQRSLLAVMRLCDCRDKLKAEVLACEENEGETACD